MTNEMPPTYESPPTYNQIYPSPRVSKGELNAAFNDYIDTLYNINIHLCWRHRNKFGNNNDPIYYLERDDMKKSMKEILLRTIDIMKKVKLYERDIQKIPQRRLH